MYKFLLVALILYSCSNQKRCSRIVAKAERFKCISFKTDTFTIHDTLNGWQYDTIFTGVNEVDTFIKEINGTKIKTVVNWRDRIIKQNGKKDTIYKTRTIYKTAATKTTYKPWFKFLVYSLIIAAVLILYKWLK
jgi:hypothetical protein